MRGQNFHVFISDSIVMLGDTENRSLGKYECNYKMLVLQNTTNLGQSRFKDAKTHK